MKDSFNGYYNTALEYELYSALWRCSLRNLMLNFSIEIKIKNQIAEGVRLLAHIFEECRQGQRAKRTLGAERLRVVLI